MTKAFSFLLAYALFAGCPDVTGQEGAAVSATQLFVTSEACMACHNGLVTPSGEDVSIGAEWRTSMMANSARDPYWHAAVRRETLDHPSARAAIENECAGCHMPMARFEAKAAGRKGEVFAHLPVIQKTGRTDRLAADGVSCTMCHQIRSDNFGNKESFTAGFSVDTSRPIGQRSIYGPFEVDKGRTRIMESASEFRPAQGSHIQDSELCATCHTLFTHALDSKGEVIGELPEQVPYLEWRHSEYRARQSCISCHMPALKEKMRITSVLGEPRSGFSRHEFLGGNFFMQAMLNRYRDDLGIEAQPEELDAAVHRTIRHLQSEAARVAIENAAIADGRLDAAISLENLGGHKLPTAYPSRRVWIHFAVRDARGAVIFESGGLNPDGSITGNHNDADARGYEPHYEVISSPDQVQIYEAIMVDRAGGVTTGLLTAFRFVKDNRILPHGFDKHTAGSDVAVQGKALQDPDFAGGRDRIRYSVPLGGSPGTFSVAVEVYYQPIAFRWARNLTRPDVPEMARFVSYYDSMATTSAVVLAGTSIRVPSNR
jgi:hypothetical protein